MTDTLLEAIREVLADHGTVPRSGNDYRRQLDDRMAAALRQCMERMEADARDAERYRWLRDNCNLIAVQTLEMNSDEDLDAAIDTAILNSREQKA